MDFGFLLSVKGRELRLCEGKRLVLRCDQAAEEESRIGSHDGKEDEGEDQPSGIEKPVSEGDDGGNDSRERDGEEHGGGSFVDGSASRIAHTAAALR